MPRPKQKQITFGYCDTETGQRVYPPPPEEATQDLLPEQVPPERKPTLNPDARQPLDGMFLKVTCWPPLGQVTVVPSNENGVRFLVLLETSAHSSSGGEQSQVCVWHNFDGQSSWGELHLTQTTDYSNVLLLGRPSAGGINQTWFTGELSGIPKHGGAVQFTVKFLIDTERGWRWIRDTTGIDDGGLHYQQADFAKASSRDFGDWYDNVSPDIKITSERPETDDTYLYSLECPVASAQGKDSGWQHHQIGLPKHSSRWFSLVRLWAPWLAPRQGKGSFSLDKDGILVSFLRTDGLHVVGLAISGVEDVVTTFISDEHGNVIIKGRNDRDEIGTSRVLVAVAGSFEVANAAVMYHARKVIRGLAVTTADAETQKLIDEKVKPEWLEEWYDGFTYCTWNGLGQKLTAQKLYDVLDDLSKEDINITNLIIDDNWQSLSSGDTQFVRGWSDFEANKEGFPDGMKVVTSTIRERHPNVQHIAVWHAILGYWGGIDPNGWIAKNYKTVQVEKEPGVAAGVFTVVAAEDAQRMYNDFYAFLSSVGIDAVKTDAQFFLDLLLHAPDRRALITEYQDAWTLAHLRHFGSRAISCMSQSPQLLFHSQLPTDKPRLLVRNSDDFFPEVEASHPWHIFCNAHNSLLTQHLNALPDWDMFQTSHPWAGFHAAARAVSGGPIYFTDAPARHDLALIRQMTANTARGKTVILRPHTVGKATDPYNLYPDPALLRIATYVGAARTGAGILGVFNVCPHPLSELLPLSEFPGTEQGTYVVGSFLSGRLSPPLSRADDGSGRLALVGVDLPPAGWEILTAYALRDFTVKGAPVRAAVMGLLGKMTGVAAVTGYEMYVEENGRLRIWVSLKALGVLGVYLSDLPGRDVENDFMVLIYGKPIPAQCVRKGQVSENVLEVDVERAWKESGEDAGWNNEVSLEVFVH